MLQRLVARTNCRAGVASAPEEAADELADIDRQAHEMAAELGAQYAIDAADVRANGVSDSPSPTLTSFLEHFGLPPASGRGFLNRITGVVRPTQDIATAEELRILSRRFALVARQLSGSNGRIRYVCGTGQVNLGGGCAGACDADAFTCGGASAIAVCPSFWTGFADNTARAAIIVHEVFHMVFAFGSRGEIVDETQRGPGRNFNVAGCYEFLVDDLFGTDSGASCPPIPD